jgi:hypothetical protein
MNNLRISVRKDTKIEGKMKMFSVSKRKQGQPGPGKYTPEGWRGSGNQAESLLEIDACGSLQNHKKEDCPAWWCTPGAPALGKQRQENQEFEASLSYIIRP